MSVDTADHWISRVRSFRHQSPSVIMMIISGSSSTGYTVENQTVMSTVKPPASPTQDGSRRYRQANRAKKPK